MLPSPHFICRLSFSLLLLSLAQVATSPVNAQGLVIPHGLIEPKIPADNPFTQEKAELGKQLYFDPRLSRDNTVSCASCHDPNKGWSNGEAVATGIGGQKGGRSAPTIINAAFAPLQFWDGRAEGLEGQALGPIQNPIEMNLTLPELEKKLNAIPGYRDQFKKVFGTEVTSENIGKAIASFERTVLCANAPYDKFKAGDKTALSESAQRGMKLFFGKANCSACHSGTRVHRRRVSQHRHGNQARKARPRPLRAFQARRRQEFLQNARPPRDQANGALYA